MHASLADLPDQRILGQALGLEAGVEDRLLVGGARAPREACFQAEARRGERYGFEERAQRHLARMSIEVVDAVRAGIVAEDRDAIARLDGEAPGLGVVAARCPARQIEDLRKRGHLGVEAGSTPCRMRRSRMRAIAMARRCIGLRLPQGLQVRTSLPRYASNWSDQG